MQQQPGNPPSRGTFHNHQQSRQGSNNNRMGPSGAAVNKDLMPVGGFQGYNNRGRGSSTINRGSQRNNVNYNYRNGLQQNFRNQTDNQVIVTHQHATSSQRGQQNSPLMSRTLPRGGGNAPPYNFQQREDQFQSFGSHGNTYNSYQPGPYGDINEFQQFPSDDRMLSSNNPNSGRMLTSNNHDNGRMMTSSNPNNGRMMSPYNNPVTNSNNSFGSQSYMNQQFNGYSENQEYFHPNAMVNRNGSMNQMSTGPSFYGNNNMVPQNSWMNGQFQTNNEFDSPMLYDTARNDSNKNVPTTSRITSTSTSKNNEVQVKAKKPTTSAVDELKKSLHFLSADIAKMKHWNMFKDSIQMMFQIFGQLDSAVARGAGESKVFQIKDDKNNTVQCIFYEIDRCLPKLTRGQWYRIVGTFDGDKGQMTCLSIRQMLHGESNLMCVLTNKSTEIMKKLSMNIREL